MLVALAGCLAFAESAAAEAGKNRAEARDSFYWLDAGMGGSSFGLSGGLGLSCQTGTSIYTFRFVYSEKLELLVSPSEAFWDVALMYGWGKWRRNRRFIGISGGPSLAGIRRRGPKIRSNIIHAEFQKRETIIPGLAIQAQFFLSPLRFAAIGLDLFADLNPDTSFAGILLCARVGRLR